METSWRWNGTIPILTVIASSIIKTDAVRIGRADALELTFVL